MGLLKEMEGKWRTEVSLVGDDFLRVEKGQAETMVGLQTGGGDLRAQESQASFTFWSSTALKSLALAV